MFEFEFFRNAFWGLLVISVAAGLIGTYIVVRRLVAIAGGVTHACFGGLGLGWFLGVNPLAMAGAFAVGSAVGVEAMGRNGRLREDSAVAVVWAVGMALGVLFVFLTPGYVPELNAFLFGNILTVGRADLWVFVGFTALLVAWLVWRWKLVVACAFDPDFARVRRLPARRISLVMTLFTAVGIVLTIKMVGVMLLMAMMTLPQLVSETFARRLVPMALGAVGVALASSMAGLWLSTLCDVPCSALIVLVQGAAFGASRAVRALLR